MRPELNQADEYLQRLAAVEAELLELEAQAEAEMAPLRQKWEAQLAPLRQRRANFDQALLILLRKARQEIFGPDDIVDLPHGLLLYSRRQVVRKSRHVLALLENLKWEEAILRTAKVRWEVLDTWNETRLISCGTERMDKDTFSYEIKPIGLLKPLNIK
jgi:hypothetical protein